MLKLVGLTGGIGSGKSTVAQILREHWVPVLDADVIARAVVEPGMPAHAEIARAWPEVIASDGRIDRKKLGAIVFADAQSRLRLEAMTHPRIREQVAEQASQHGAAGHGLAFLEAALLVETGFYQQLDGLVVVAASEEVQVERVMARDGTSREEVLARIHAQFPLAEKICVADYVVDNSGSRDQTRAQILKIVQALTQWQE
jgi:dephospho-CoA kinase